MKFARVMALVASLVVLLTGCIWYTSFDSDPRVLRGSWSVSMTKSNKPRNCRKEIIWNASSDQMIVDAIMPSIFSNNGTWLQSIKLDFGSNKDLNPFSFGYPYLYRNASLQWKYTNGLIGVNTYSNQPIPFYSSLTGQKVDFSLVNASKLLVIGISDDLSKIALLDRYSPSEHSLTTVLMQDIKGNFLDSFSTYSNYGGIQVSPNFQYAIVNNNNMFEIWSLSSKKIISSISKDYYSYYIFNEVQNTFIYAQKIENSKYIIKKLDLISKLETSILDFDLDFQYLRLFPNFIVKVNNVPNSSGIWNLTTQSKILELSNAIGSEIIDVSISPDGQKVAVSRNDAQCSTKIISLQTGLELFQLKLEEPTTIIGSLTFQASFLDQNKYNIIGTGTLEGIGAVTITGTGYSKSFEAWTKSNARSSASFFNADLQVLDSTGRIRLVSMPEPVSTFVNQPVTSESARSKTQLQGEMLGAFGTWYDARLTPMP
jgi:hypothetical protein